MNTAFWWIGVGVVGTIAVGCVGCALLYAYALLIHRRFSWIPFRRTERRISMASWHNARLMNDPDYKADAWDIGQRPFLLQYQVGKRRLFVMLGSMAEPRGCAIRGVHPDQPA